MSNFLCHFDKTHEVHLFHSLWSELKTTSNILPNAASTWQVCREWLYCLFPSPEAINESQHDWQPKTWILEGVAKRANQSKQTPQRSYGVESTEPIWSSWQDEKWGSKPEPSLEPCPNHRPGSQNRNQAIGSALDTHRKSGGSILESQCVRIKYSSTGHAWEAVSVLFWREVDRDSGGMCWNPVLSLASSVIWRDLPEPQSLRL